MSGSSVPMKVLLCVPELGKRGGVANYYRAVNEHFSMDVQYFTRGSRGGSQTRLGGLSRLVADYAHFLRTLRRDPEIGIVHLNTSFGPKGIFRDSVFLLLAKLQRKKVLVFLRGWDEKFEREATRPTVRLALRSFFLADRMLVLAERFRDRLQHWGYRGEIGTESTVVDQVLMEAATTAARERPAPPGAGCTILFLARLERDKGVYTAVDTHAALLRRYPDLRLLIAGDGSEWENLARYVEERQIRNVEFLGYVRGKEKIAAFQRADLYLFPSSHGEGMPNSVLEAMAFGLPVVARRVGGLEDFFREGEMGLLTDATDAATFVELVGRLIESPTTRARISRTNHRYAAERFAAPKVVARLEAIYRQMLIPQA
jgi:glycosyltransferase involved in cell wall biosynthesis